MNAYFQKHDSLSRENAIQKESEDKDAFKLMIKGKSKLLRLIGHAENAILLCAKIA